jgi:hypothetical protein
MKIKKAIIQIMDRDQLKQVCDEFELYDVDRRSKEDMARKLSRTHRAKRWSLKNPMKKS